jgi:hypothetical protein
MQSKKANSSINTPADRAFRTCAARQHFAVKSLFCLRVGLFQFIHRSFLAGLVAFVIAAITIMVVAGCKDGGRSAPEQRWDRVAEGQNKELFYIDRRAIVRLSDDVVRVSVKYVPLKDEFLVSLKELSKEFGGKGGEDVEAEYTLSTWEFSCTKMMGRCLSLLHFRKGTKIASYQYPEQPWVAIDNATSTKILRDLVCAEAAR